MNIPRIKLQWGTAKQQPGNWYLGLLGFYQRKSGGRSQGLAISLRGAVLWGLAACVAGYFAVAGYVFWKLDQRAYNFVKYEDILLFPVRKDEIDRLRGQASIAEGFDELKVGNWRGGVMLLRIGLEKNPRDLRARLEVAKFFIAAKLRVKAKETLMEGLSYGYPGRAYLESVLDNVTAGEDYELVVELCDRALALHDPTQHPAADRRWLLEKRIRALLAEERSEDALEFAERMVGGIDDMVLSELRLLALLQAKRLEDAVAFAEEWRTRSGETSQVLRFLARTYRETGQLEDMAAVLDRMRRLTPADPRPRAFGIIQLMLSGREATAREQLDDYIFRFGGTVESFILIANPLAEIKRLPELELVLAAAAERGMRDVRLSSARLQALMGERRWTEATIQLENLQASLPPDGLNRGTMLELFGVIIGAASDPAEGAQTNLTNYLSVRQLPMSAYRQTITVLRDTGRIGTAREVVRLAEGVFPDNRYLVNMRTELDTEIAAARETAEAGRVVKVADPALVSADTFYAELQTIRAADGELAALALIRELRQTAPAWMGREAEPLGRLELELYAAGDDLVALQAATRRYVNTDSVRIQAAVTVATTLFEAGATSEARVVLDELLRRVPEQPAALALKAKWFPPPKPEELPASGQPATEAAIQATAP